MKRSSDVISNTKVKPTRGKTTYRCFETGNAPTVRSWEVYLGALINSSAEIFQLLQTSDVIVDRYLATTICYHEVSGAAVDCVDWRSLPIAKPDFEFCLAVSDRREWLRRIAQRDGADTKIAMEREYKRFMVISRRLSAFTESRGGTTIDTSKLSPAQVVETMLNIVQAR